MSNLNPGDEIIVVQWHDWGVSLDRIRITRTTPKAFWGYHYDWHGNVDNYERLFWRTDIRWWPYTPEKMAELEAAKTAWHEAYKRADADFSAIIAKGKTGNE